MNKSELVGQVAELAGLSKADADKATLLRQAGLKSVELLVIGTNHVGRHQLADLLAFPSRHHSPPQFLPVGQYSGSGGHRALPRHRMIACLKRARQMRSENMNQIGWHPDSEIPTGTTSSEER